MPAAVANVTVNTITQTSAIVEGDLTGIVDSQICLLYTDPTFVAASVSFKTGNLTADGHEVWSGFTNPLVAGTTYYLRFRDMDTLAFYVPTSGLTQFTTLSSAPKSVSDTVMDGLVGTGSLRDKQMAAHVAAGRTTGSYKDRCVTAGSEQFPR